ncbi:hypothetical protein RFI_30453 [Reticulomyxa filosa]|uniref:Uncharacterized protein n=1 Tax=Reticulomyxa filosa TaxID=46433 RepID=X6M0L2_RETFI|nr:hypothetical protein RFI_30453 [Reticulomyxa filosa]|eukprot:ETO06937.1 hypothetical protein RFI_30453 [Reticulomyxa filosa]
MKRNLAQFQRGNANSGHQPKRQRVNSPGNNNSLQTQNTVRSPIYTNANNNPLRGRQKRERIETIASERGVIVRGRGTRGISQDNPILNSVATYLQAKPNTITKPLTRTVAVQRNRNSSTNDDTFDISINTKTSDQTSTTTDIETEQEKKISELRRLALHTMGKKINANNNNNSNDSNTPKQEQADGTQNKKMNVETITKGNNDSAQEQNAEKKAKLLLAADDATMHQLSAGADGIANTTALTTSRGSVLANKVLQQGQRRTAKHNETNESNELKATQPHRQPDQTQEMKSTDSPKKQAETSMSATPQSSATAARTKKCRYVGNLLSIQQKEDAADGNKTGQSIWSRIMNDKALQQEYFKELDWKINAYQKNLEKLAQKNNIELSSNCQKMDWWDIWTLCQNKLPLHSKYHLLAKEIKDWEEKNQKQT